MNIIIFPASYYPILGGIQEVAYRLAKEFIKKGNNTRIITQRYPRLLTKNEVLDDITVHRILFPNLFPTSFKTKPLLKFAAGLFFAPLAFINLCILLNREKPDVVYLHFIGIGALYLLACRVFKKFKLIVSLHGDDVEELPQQSNFNRWLFKKTCHSADFVIACSEYILKKAKRICPVIEKKSRTIHNGIDLSEFNNINPYPNSRPYIFAAGRFVHKKGFDILIKAYSHLVEKNHKIDLILAGAGEKLEEYKKIAKNIGIRWVKPCENAVGYNSRIIYWGRAERNEMNSLIAGAAMVAVPSRKEPFGLIVLEAMAIGSPVVAYEVGGIPEIISDNCGLLVQPENEIALSQAMEKLIIDKKLRAQVIEKGKKQAQGFKWEKAAEKYLLLAKFI